MAETKSREKERPRRSSGSGSGGGRGGGESEGSNLVDILFWVLLVLVAFSVVKGIFAGFGFSLGLPSAAGFFSFVFEKLQVYSIFLSLIFFIGIIYFNFRVGELAHQSHARRHGASGEIHPSQASHEARPHPPSAFRDKHAPDKRWQMVETRLNSFSEGDWRLAVIEADIILSEMLGKIGYQGDGVAERLKKADKGTFHTLDSAWEAHKLRNRIAHDGAAFHLSHDEAKRAIGLYKKVFDEFYFV